MRFDDFVLRDKILVRRGTEPLSGNGGNPSQNRYLGEPGVLAPPFFVHAEHVAERKDQLRTEQLERAN